jgi:cation:H+ antiporter
VIAVLAVVVMGTQLPADLSFARLDPASPAITAVWITGLILLDRAGKGLPWREGGDAPDTQPEPRGHSKDKKEKAATDKAVGTARAALVFGAAAVATLVAGVVIERSGETFFDRQGLSGILFGATVLAAATSPPS